MNLFKLRNLKLENEEVFENYVDVFVHCENNAIIKAHKIILAQHSSFFHRFFMSREGMREADMFFLTMKQYVVQKAIDVIYGRIVRVEENERKRVAAFLRMLLVDFEFMPSDEEGSEDNINMGELNRTFENPRKGAFVPPSISEPMKSATDKIVEEPVLSETHEKIEELDENWTVTTASDQRVSEVEHTWKRLQNLNRNEYTCNYCGEVCFSIRKAERHFTNVHLDIQSKVQLMADIDQTRKKLCHEYANLVETFKQNGSNILVRHEMELLVDKLTELKTKLGENISTKIPPQHAHKKKTLENNLLNFKTEIAEFIRNNLD